MRSDRWRVCWTAYNAMQSRINENRSWCIGGVRNCDCGGQYRGSANALKYAPHRTFVLIAWRTARHVGLIGHRHFNWCYGSRNSGSPDWRQGEGSGNQSGQNHTGESHTRTIRRYGSRVNRVSALGQKRTFWPFITMSALPTGEMGFRDQVAGQQFWAACPLWVKSGHGTVKSRCPLYPQKRTLTRVELSLS